MGYFSNVLLAGESVRSACPLRPLPRAPSQKQNAPDHKVRGKLDREETPDRAGCVAKRSNRKNIRCTAQMATAIFSPYMRLVLTRILCN